MEITYEAIKPIIVSETVAGNQVTVKFKADGMEQEVQGIGMIVPDTNEVVKNVGKETVKRGVVHGIIGSLSRLFGNAVGSAVGGTAGSITSNVASSATSSMGHAAAEAKMGNSAEAMMKVKVTPEKQQAAAVQAFQSVHGYFKWDEQTKRWTANQPVQA